MLYAISVCHCRKRTPVLFLWVIKWNSMSVFDSQETKLTFCIKSFQSLVQQTVLEDTGTNSIISITLQCHSVDKDSVQSLHKQAFSCYTLGGYPAALCRIKVHNASSFIQVSRWMLYCSWVFKCLLAQYHKAEWPFITLNYMFPSCHWWYFDCASNDIAQMEMEGIEFRIIMTCQAQ